MGRWLALTVFIICLFSACSNASGLLLFKKDSVLPYILFEKEDASKSIDLFRTLFKKATGKEIELATTMKTASAGPLIHINLERDSEKLFVIKSDGQHLHITGNSNDNLILAIHYFFNTYVYPEEDFNTYYQSLALEQILLPANLHTDNEKAFAFAYREPYFPANSTLAFQQRFNTQSLENQWGLWGHNIHKLIRPTEAMYAIIDGAPNEEQYNFSSPALEAALKSAIKESLDNAPEKKYFVIMPNDNELVCQCDACKKLGNTETNATPAVVHLISKLAASFPQAVFFTSDYVTTSTPPEKVMPSNTGVIISTMDFPKGVVLADSKQKNKIAERFKKWKSVTNQLFVWDYAVNFDNYMDAYPTLLLQQENLKFYRSLGVTGIFMQGNETGYAAFEQLKARAYAKLMENPDANVEQLIRDYFHYIAGEQGRPLSDYFIDINLKALTNKPTLDIYGGIQQSTKKYLNDDVLQKFYDALSVARKNSKPEFQSELMKLQLSSLFQLLEIARTNGLQQHGWGNYDPKTKQLQIHADIKSRLDEFKAIRSMTGLQTYNEVNNSFQDYLRQWDDLLKSSYQNELFGQLLAVKSKLDEDYNDPSVLTDGAIGFLDYYNNWMIFTQDDLKIEIPMTDQIRQSKNLQLSFLVDKKHKLALPKAIQVGSDTRSNIARQELQTSAEKLKKLTYNIPLTINETDNTLKLIITKDKNVGFACDEIILK